MRFSIMQHRQLSLPLKRIFVKELKFHFLFPDVKAS